MLRVRQANQVLLVLAATRQSTNLRSMLALEHLLKHRLIRAKPVFLVNLNRQIQLNSNQLVYSVHLKPSPNLGSRLVEVLEAFSQPAECSHKTECLQVDLFLVQDPSYKEDCSRLKEPLSNHLLRCNNSL